LAGKAARLVGRPRSDHAAQALGIEGAGIGDVVGHAHRPEVVDDGEFRLAAGVEPSAQMLQPIMQQVVIRAPEESVRVVAGGVVPVAFDRQSLAAPPSVADAPVERVQHRKGDMGAGDRHAGGKQPFAQAVDHVLQAGFGQGLVHQPLRCQLEQRPRGGGAGEGVHGSYI
jgi:hypothetical protein